MLCVHPVTDSLPEMDMARWLRFVGATRQGLLLGRAFLLAYAASFANEFVVASLWCDADRRLRGIAVGMVQRHPLGRRILGITAPIMTSEDRGSGLWITEGEDREEVGGLLLRGLLDHCRARQISQLSVSWCPASDEQTRRVAANIGCRTLPAPADHRILLSEGATFDSYLGGLGAKRRNWFRRDLRRAEETGARMVEEIDPPEATLAQIWPLQVDAMQRKGRAFEGGQGNLFSALRALLPPGMMVVTRCLRGERLLGFLMCLRLERATEFVHVGHVSDAGMQTYTALIATAIRQEIQRGACVLVMGWSMDRYKYRLGCGTVPYVHHQLSLHAHAPADHGRHGGDAGQVLRHDVGRSQLDAEGVFDEGDQVQQVD